MFYSKVSDKCFNCTHLRDQLSSEIEHPKADGIELHGGAGRLGTWKPT